VSALETRVACTNTVAVGLAISPFVIERSTEITRNFSVRCSLVEGVVIT